MDGWELFNWAGSVGFSLALVPQLRRTWTLRRADDISRKFLWLVLASSGFMLTYMAHAGNWVFAFAQGMNLLVWGIVLYFRVRPGAPATPKAMA
jgi:uncharacterized protein with PQ loop repeat